MAAVQALCDMKAPTCRTWWPAVIPGRDGTIGLGPTSVTEGEGGALDSWRSKALTPVAVTFRAGRSSAARRRPTPGPTM